MTAVNVTAVCVWGGEEEEEEEEGANEDDTKGGRAEQEQEQEEQEQEQEQDKEEQEQEQDQELDGALSLVHGSEARGAREHVHRLLPCDVRRFLRASEHTLSAKTQRPMLRAQSQEDCAQSAARARRTGGGAPSCRPGSGAAPSRSRRRPARQSPPGTAPPSGTAAPAPLAAARVCLAQSGRTMRHVSLGHRIPRAQAGRQTDERTVLWRASVIWYHHTR
eukprot:1015593-Rhodomonas_salina.1